MKWTVLILFNFGFKKENEMEDNQEGSLQLISAENYFQDIPMSNIQVLFWNLIDFNILMFQF